ncbi:MAG: hypothetical protein QOD98_3422 [Nocardioidaceae bacterium]|jgi:hypothetical protein|nr:hypothetical protein [Nocardioidaceae bacterium]
MMIAAPSCVRGRGITGSLATGKTYDVRPAPAQQGFPSISGRQLVWQDATNGADDVFTAAIPGGL